LFTDAEDAMENYEQQVLEEIEEENYEEEELPDFD
jgi:hypothetical protein